MSEADFFLHIYPLVPLAGLAAFVPQILALIRTQEAAKSISVFTWSVWTITWSISFGYAFYTVQDTLIALTCAMNVIGHGAVAVIAYSKNRKYAHNPKENLLCGDHRFNPVQRLIQAFFGYRKAKAQIPF